jgi:cobalt-zinc-cadmium resistance protein CzcA
LLAVDLLSELIERKIKQLTLEIKKMNKLIYNIISASLKNKAVVFLMTAVLVFHGIYSYLQTPLEAFPDVTNTQIMIVTQWAGRSAEEVERFITIPIEVGMNSVQKKTSVRSISMFGLSVIKIIFDDGIEDFFARQQVNNLLKSVALPEGAEVEVQPPYGPTGEIFRYTLTSKDRKVYDLLTIQDWTIDRHLRRVEGVADIVSFGGSRKIFEIQVNPILLSKYDLTPLEVYEAVTKSNINVGGDIIEKNGQAFVVRGIGLLKSISDIENIIVKHIKDVPILVKNVAKVIENSLPKVGQAGLDDQDDVVEGIVVMRKGENPSKVLHAVKEKIEELNTKILPADVKIQTFYDRDVLMKYCQETVLHNLIEGIIFVTVIVFMFMADWRTTLIVALIIPLALLFAFMCLRFMGMSANLLSMGAVDFGIIIDGAVVMVEGVFVVLAHKAEHKGMVAFNRMSKAGTIKKTSIEMGKAIFFSKLIILTSLLPIFAFQKVEGKMFSPLAFTLGFALLGALIYTLTLVPVLIAVLLNKNVKEYNNPIVNFFDFIVNKGFSFTYKHKRKSLLTALLVTLLGLYSFTFLGTEFLPTLNEGALWITAEMPMSQSLPETAEIIKKFRKELQKFDEVNGTLSQIGRSNDGTDPNGFYFAQIQVNLKPKEQWKRKISYDDLVDEMDKKLRQYPGIIFNYSQPIIDNVAEAVAGFKASFGVKIFGNNLETIDAMAEKVAKSLEKVEGIKDVGVLKNIGQPELSITLDQDKMARYGIAIADAEAVIEMAIGGKTATQFYEGERKFDVRLRYEPESRRTENDIQNLKVPSLKGNKIPLKEFALIEKKTGAAFVYREANSRFIGVKFSIRGRDMGSTIAEAQTEIKKIFPTLSKGYKIDWVGEFENQQRASKTLAQVVPLCLLGIFVLLLATFGNAKDAGLVLLNVPFALLGGILALHITGTIFSISAGIGFIALFGVCIQNGVILISVFKKNLKEKIPLTEAIKKGVSQRTRAVVMTALMAAIGLLPAAISTGIGSETQKPLAIVVIGGMISATILTLLIFPLIFEWGYKNNQK